MMELKEYRSFNDQQFEDIFERIKLKVFKKMSIYDKYRQKICETDDASLL